MGGDRRPASTGLLMVVVSNTALIIDITSNQTNIITHISDKMTTLAPPLQIFRGILRHAKSLQSRQSAFSVPTASAPPHSRQETASESHISRLALHDHVCAQYRANRLVSPSRAAVLRKMAADYLRLSDDLKERGRLHELDGGADVKLSTAELTKRAASRAGLLVPDLSGLHE